MRRAMIGMRHTVRPSDRSFRAPMRYLTFEASEGAEGVMTLEAVALTLTGSPFRQTYANLLIAEQIRC